jgi:flagellin
MISINYNGASGAAAYNLANTNVNLQRSLQRLSSGSRINSSFDDAGGLAVSMKMSASIRRTEATQANVGNAISLLQTQDGVLKSADKVLIRMSELATLAQDVTKSTTDLALYSTELDQLKGQLNLMLSEKFNGITLFHEGAASGATINTAIDTGTSGNTLVVVTSHDGAQSVGITRADLNAIAYDITDANSTNALNITSNTGAQAAVDSIQDAIQNLATLRANNGAEQTRLTFAADMLSVNKINLEAANSRIIDVDVASESAQLARFNILQQAGTAMLAQANQSTQSILRLIS